jgi:hypothetical protein
MLLGASNDFAEAALKVRHLDFRQLEDIFESTTIIVLNGR